MLPEPASPSTDLRASDAVKKSAGQTAAPVRNTSIISGSVDGDSVGLRQGFGGQVSSGFFHASSASRVDATEPHRVVLAEILRERGNRGEVTARSQTDIPGRLESLKSARLHLADGTDREVTLEEAWPHKGDWVLKFAQVDSISDAEKLRGSDLWVPFEERTPLPEGEYYESDLVGCALRDLTTNELIGRVTGMQRFGGAPLLEVDRKGREVLIPFVPAICQQVDLEAREIRAELPEGLLEL